MDRQVLAAFRRHADLQAVLVLSTDQEHYPYEMELLEAGAMEVIERRSAPAVSWTDT